MPELSEPEVVRHFVRLSQWNYGIDSGPYPLGSCTMKYNPKSNEALARLPGFAQPPPDACPKRRAQGALQLRLELERALSRNRRASPRPRCSRRPARKASSAGC